jgi:pimeloyl-ACP methyl ester carboxylesterase
MRLVVDQRGEGSAVVFLHGFPLDRDLWAAQREALSDRWRVITPDLRGHGASPAPAGVYRMHELAQDVLETVEGPLVVVGHSMGGYVALALAEEAPERVRGLVLVNSRTAADPPEAAHKRLDSASKVEATGSVETTIEAMLPKLFAPGTAESRPDLVAEWSNRMRRTAPAGVAGALLGMAERPDRAAILSSAKFPVLLLAGEEDQIIPAEEAMTMATLSPRCELVVLPAVGHMAPVEDPRGTSAALRRFLERLG